MRRCLALLFLLAPAAAQDFGRELRGLRADDRERREAVLEALASGRMEPSTRSEAAKAGRGLLRFLSSKSLGPERALAVRGLGRLGRPRVWDELLDWLEEERDDRVLHAAEEAFGRAPPDLAGDLAQRILKAKEPVPRANYVRMLGALPGDEARERTRLRAAMADHWCPRSAAIHALARDRDPAALETLVTLLDDEDPAVLTAATESLTRLTGKPFGREVAEWKAWWAARDRVEALEKAIEEAGKGERRTYAHETERRTVAVPFFGIPVEGRRVVFVFDVSASMRYKLPLAYDQLERTVKGLPSSVVFEVVFFNEFVWPWRGRMCHADPVTKQMLVDHLPSIEIKSYTNLFDSVEKALALEPDEVFIISDGAPNRGRKRYPRDILAELETMTPAATKIHTISVVRTVDGDDHIELLAAIAAQHNGEHIQRTLR